ncbi:hypothetical protein [Streptomyces humi]
MAAVCRHTGRDPFPAQVLAEGNRITAVAERVPRDLAAEARVVAYADAMTREVRVPDELFDALRADFDETELVGLTATVAVHNMVSRFLVALEIDPEK